MYLPLIYKYECNGKVLQKIIVQFALRQYRSNSEISEGCTYEQNFLVRKDPRAGDKLTQKLLLVLQILLINKIFAYWIFTVNLVTFLFFFLFFFLLFFFLPHLTPQLISRIKLQSTSDSHVGWWAMYIMFWENQPPYPFFSIFPVFYSQLRKCKEALNSKQKVEFPIYSACELIHLKFVLTIKITCFP